MSSTNSTTTTEILLSTPTRLHGVTAISVAGLLSVLCVLMLLSAFAYSTRRSWGKPDNSVSGLQRFLRSSLGLYLLSTLIADGLLGAAYVVGFHWTAEARIHDSAVCRFQGGLIQFSDALTGMCTLALSVHTFLVLVPMRPPPRKVALVVLPVFWMLSLFTSFIGPVAIQRNDISFYAPLGSWCWISSTYEPFRFVLLYAGIWLTMTVSCVCYVWIFLALAGVIRTTARLTESSTNTANSSALGMNSVRSERRLNHQTSRKLLYYPASYLLVFLPISITRILNVRKHKVPLPLVIFAGLCLASSGTVNVILFVSTRWSLLSNIGETHSTEDRTNGTSISFSEAIATGADGLSRPTASRRPSTAVSFTLGPLTAATAPLRTFGSAHSERHLSNDSGVSGVVFAKGSGGSVGSFLTEPDEREEREEELDHADEDDGDRGPTLMDFYAAIKS